jgi:gliding motility-associated-like protein
MWTSVDATPEICAPKQVKLSDTLTVSTYPITSRLWNIGNGQPLSSDTIIFTTYPSKGTYNISLIEQTSNGCADTAQKTITLYKPEGNFTMNKDQICRYDAIDFTLKDTVDVTSWTWSFGDGVNISNQNPISHPYDFHPPGGTTLAKLTLYKGTCPNNPPIEHPVTIYQLISDFTRLNGTDSSICFTSGDIYHFDNISSGGYTTWGWDFGDNTTSSDFNPDHKYLVPGNYDVTLAIANATCKDTIRKTAYVYPNPVVLGIGDTVCDGNTLQLHVANPNAASTYTWSPSTGLSNINDLNPTANIPSTLTYTLTETTQDGCVDSTSVTGIVIEPDWMHDWDTTIVIGDYATLPAHGRPVYSFLWTPTDSLSCLNCDYPKTNPLSDITYTVQVSDVRNCYNPSYLYTVKVHPETFIKMPTAFSPNGDGNNDILYVTGWGIKELKSFQIFNRWGQLIYSSSDIAEGWNGKYKGSFQNEDVYVYKITGIDWRDKELHLEGYVNLLH